MRQDCLLEHNVTGLQHVGVPVRDLLESVSFYERLGFERIMSSEVERKDQPRVRVAMMKLGTAVIELYQLSHEELSSRADGHVDHVALNVRDIEAAFREMTQAGIEVIEGHPVFLNFWAKGCRYFSVRGPDGEKLEFNQIC
jgi:catechol 2,3-dioxygenase-like lactoylglutathione lyase family enzyme